MMNELTLWQQLLLAGLAFISFIYIFYFKIWVTLAAGSDLVFALALSVAVASVAVPPLFDRAARVLVDRSALPEALIGADQKVAAIEALPSKLIARALAKVGYAPDEVDAAVSQAGLPVDAQPEVERPSSPGPFESSIRPSVEALVSAVLRTASFCIATLLLLMALSLRSSTSTARALQSLSNRTDDLESRLALKMPVPEPSRREPETTHST
jgi:hypothetical protein